MVQRAVYFNDALIASQKQRVEYEATLAALQVAVRNGQDLGQYMMAVSDAVGRQLLLSNLGLGDRDAIAQANLRKTCSMPALSSKPGNKTSARYTPRLLP